MVRGALRALLSLEEDLDVVAEIARGDEVVDAALCHRPDVALLDIEMPGLDGLSATAALREAFPDCRVIILTTFGRPGYLRRALEAGAVGFLLKDGPADQLAAAIRRVMDGSHEVDPVLAATALRDGASPLTPRERDVLLAARNGGSVRAIATDLNLATGTVRNLLSTAIQKLGVGNRAEAVLAADRHGWL